MAGSSQCQTPGSVLPKEADDDRQLPVQTRGSGGSVLLTEADDGRQSKCQIRGSILPKEADNDRQLPVPDSRFSTA